MSRHLKPPVPLTLKCRRPPLHWALFLALSHRRRNSVKRLVLLWTHQATSMQQRRWTQASPVLLQLKESPSCLGTSPPWIPTLCKIPSHLHLQWEYRVIRCIKVFSRGPWIPHPCRHRAEIRPLWPHKSSSKWWSRGCLLPRAQTTHSCLWTSPGFPLISLRDPRSYFPTYIPSSTPLVSVPPLPLGERWQCGRFHLTAVCSNSNTTKRVSESNSALFV